ncbi:hypothetical protein ATE72_19080 [Sphingopyxis sp. HXXIV]|nr:hypothetical protein ATE72_19080 [Sphingopyxis sp. HXXIV]
MRAGNPVLAALLRAAGTNIQALLESYPRIARLFSGVARICRQERDKERLKDHLMALMRGESPDPPPLDASTDVSIFQAVQTATALEALQGLPEAVAAIAAQLAKLDRDVVGLLLDHGQSGNVGKLADRIKYNSGLHYFAGREKEIELLDRFLGETVGWSKLHAFQWLLLTADGGTGKTRLAVEYAREHLPPGWVGGLLKVTDLDTVIQTAPGWAPNAPTLLIIDYPAKQAADVHLLLVRLLQRADEFVFAVRVLLLERNADGSWLDRVFPPSSIGSSLRRHAFVLDGTALEKGLPIEAPDWGAIIEITHRRLDQARADGRPVPDDQEAIMMLLSFMASVDRQPAVPDPHGNLMPGPPRPLFVAATLEWALEAFAQGKPLDQLLDDAESRDILFDGILARDRSEFWSPAATARQADLTRHENLLALASFTLGLPDALKAKEAADAVGIGDLFPRDPEAEVLRRMTALEDGRLAELQPDLLGEFHAIQRLEAIRRNGGLATVARFCQLAYRLGGGEAGVFASRCLRDFPEHLPGLDWLAPPDGASEAEVAPFAGLCMDATASLAPQLSLPLIERLDRLTSGTSWNADAGAIDSYAKALFNLVSRISEGQAWEHLAFVTARLDRLAHDFPGSESIAIEEANALVNLAGRIGEHQAWEHLTLLTARLARLARDFPDSEPIAVEEAKGCKNLAGHIGRHQAWAHLPALTARLDRLARDFPDSEPIVLEEGKAFFNLASQIGEHRAWEHLHSLTERFDRLARDFPDSEPIATEEVKAMVNLAGHTGEYRAWKHLPLFTARLDRLARDFPDSETIAREDAKASKNFASGVGKHRAWKHLPSLTSRFDRLARDFPDSEPIAVEEAEALFNLISGAGQHQAWEHLPLLTARFDRLARDFPGSETIALEEAKTLFNLASRIGEHQAWEHITALSARLDRLARDFPGNEPVAIQEAKASKNLASHIGRQQAWEHLPLLTARFDRLVRDFPGSEVVAMEEVSALFMLTSGIGEHQAWAHWPVVHGRLEGLIARTVNGDLTLSPIIAANIAAPYVAYGFFLTEAALLPDPDTLAYCAAQCLICLATFDHAPEESFGAVAAALIKYWHRVLPENETIRQTWTTMTERMGVDWDDVPDLRPDD